MIKIYDRTVAIVAVKGPGHPCDAKCKQAQHTFIHRFKKGNETAIYGSQDGKSLTIGGRGPGKNPSTRTATRTATSTKAHTAGNITVTGGAGRGATTSVTVRRNPRR